jgi:exopolysaccharide production protein ExoQ
MIHTEEDKLKFFSQIQTLLLIILFIKLGGFFTWSENINITRIIKIISRFSMTALVIWVRNRILERGASSELSWKFALSPILYCAYLGLGLISFLWSTNIGYSSLQWLMDFESIVFAYFFIQCFILLDGYFPESKIKLYHVTGNAVFLMILVFLIGMYINPDDFYRLTHGGEEARLGGFFMNPNELGMLCAVGISCLIFNLYRNHRKVWTIIKVILILWALVLTGSRSSTIGALLIAFFHIRQSSNVKLKLAMYASSIMAIPIAIEKIIVKEHGGGLEEVMSMTGRLPFWQALITEGLPKEPLLGFGFMRIAYKDYFQGVNTYAGQMTHNTFIQVLMNLGFIGFTIVLFQLFFTMKATITEKVVDKKLMVLGMFIPILINSFTEFGIFGETNYGILFYQLIIFYITMQLPQKLSVKESIKLNIRKKRFQWLQPKQDLETANL